MVDFAPISAAGSCRSLERFGQPVDVDALSGKTDRSRSASALTTTATRSYAGQSKEWHRNGFSCDWQSGVIAQTARNSSRMAERQAKEAAATLSGSPKARKTANSGCFSCLKVDC
jgi:hypothetical protein